MVTVFLKNSRESAIREWTENQAARRCEPDVPHKVREFRSWNATYTGNGSINWIDGRLRIHFHFKADPGRFIRGASAFLRALGRHGVIEDWWSQPVFMSQGAEVWNPVTSTWVPQDPSRPFAVDTGTRLRVGAGRGLLWSEMAIESPSAFEVTVGAWKAPPAEDGWHGFFDIELAISSLPAAGQDGTVEMISYGMMDWTSLSTAGDGAGALEPLKLRASRANINWTIDSERAAYIDIDDRGPDNGYTADREYVKEIARKQKEYAEWLKTIEGRIWLKDGHPEPGEWDISITAEGPDPLRFDMHSKVALAIEPESRADLRVYQGRVDVTHLNTGRKVTVPEGFRYKTSLGQPGTEPVAFNPNAVPWVWGQPPDSEPDTATTTAPTPGADARPKWAFDDPAVWSLNEDSLVMAGTGAFKKRWALLERDFTDFTCEIQLRKREGDGGEKVYPYGVWVHTDESASNGWELSLDCQGQFRLARRDGGKATRLMEWEKSPALQEGVGAWNTITVVSEGDTVAFYANGTHLKNLKLAGSAYRSGRVGLFAVDGKDEVRDVVECRKFSVNIDEADAQVADTGAGGTATPDTGTGDAPTPDTGTADTGPAAPARGSLSLVAAKSDRDLVGNTEEPVGDGVPDCQFRLDITAPGRTITSLTIGRIGHAFPRWDTIVNGNWLVGVGRGRQLLNEPDGTVRLTLGPDETSLDLYFTDGGAVAAGSRDLNATVAFADGTTEVFVLGEPPADPPDDPPGDTTTPAGESGFELVAVEGNLDLVHGGRRSTDQDNSELDSQFRLTFTAPQKTITDICISWLDDRAPPAWDTQPDEAAALLLGVVDDATIYNSDDDGSIRIELGDDEVVYDLYADGYAQHAGKFRDLVATVTFLDGSTRRFPLDGDAGDAPDDPPVDDPPPDDPPEDDVSRGPLPKPLQDAVDNPRLIYCRTLKSFTGPEREFGENDTANPGEQFVRIEAEEVLGWEFRVRDPGEWLRVGFRLETQSPNKWQQVGMAIVDADHKLIDARWPMEYPGDSRRWGRNITATKPGKYRIYLYGGKHRWKGEGSQGVLTLLAELGTSLDSATRLDELLTRPDGSWRAPGWWEKLETGGAEASFTCRVRPGIASWHLLTWPTQDHLRGTESFEEFLAWKRKPPSNPRGELSVEVDRGGANAEIGFRHAMSGGNWPESDRTVGPESTTVLLGRSYDRSMVAIRIYIPEGDPEAKVEMRVKLRL